MDISGKLIATTFACHDLLRTKKHYFALPLMDSRKEEMQRTGLVIFVPRNTQVEVIEVDGDQFVVQILDPGFPEGKYVVNRYCFKLDATDDLWPAAVGDLGYIRESHGNDVAVAETSEGLRKYEDMSLGDRLSMDWHNDSSNPNSITVTPPYERYGVEMLDRNTRVRILKVSRTYLTVQIEDGHSAGRTFVVSRFNFYHRAS